MANIILILLLIGVTIYGLLIRIIEILYKMIDIGLLMNEEHLELYYDDTFLVLSLLIEQNFFQQ